MSDRIGCFVRVRRRRGVQRTLLGAVDVRPACLSECPILLLFQMLSRKHIHNPRAHIQRYRHRPLQRCLTPPLTTVSSKPLLAAPIANSTHAGILEEEQAGEAHCDVHNISTSLGPAFARKWYSRWSVLTAKPPKASTSEQ